MQFDITIVGGGMVGATMACALSHLPYKIALIDASPISSDDHRLIALSYRSICLLKKLNCWDDLEKQATAIEQIHLSHRKHFGISRIRAEELGLKSLGYVVPAKYITPALYSNLNNVTLIRPASLKNLTQNDNEALLSLLTPKGVEDIATRFLIGADGTQSTVRQLLNIPIKTVDYQQSALVTKTQLKRSHHHIAFERFQKEGAIAMLPLNENKVATIWTGSNQNISQLMQLNETAFLEKLQEQFGFRLGKFIGISSRYTYPLTRVQAERQVSQQAILIGNAAHTMHPIAAQGLNLSFYEIAVLA